MPKSDTFATSKMFFAIFDRRTAVIASSARYQSGTATSRCAQRRHAARVPPSRDRSLRPRQEQLGRRAGSHAFSESSSAGSKTDPRRRRYTCKRRNASNGSEIGSRSSCQRDALCDAGSKEHRSVLDAVASELVGKAVSVSLIMKEAAGERSALSVRQRQRRTSGEAISRSIPRRSRPGKARERENNQ